MVADGLALGVVAAQEPVLHGDLAAAVAGQVQHPVGVEGVAGLSRLEVGSPGPSPSTNVDHAIESSPVPAHQPQPLLSSPTWSAFRRRRGSPSRGDSKLKLRHARLDLVAVRGVSPGQPPSAALPIAHQGQTTSDQISTSARKTPDGGDAAGALSHDGRRPAILPVADVRAARSSLRPVPPGPATVLLPFHEQADRVRSSLPLDAPSRARRRPPRPEPAQRRRRVIRTALTLALFVDRVRRLSDPRVFARNDHRGSRRLRHRLPRPQQGGAYDIGTEILSATDDGAQRHSLEGRDRRQQRVAAHCATRSPAPPTRTSLAAQLDLSIFDKA